MPWYHRIATFLNHSLPQLRATRRTNLALLTCGHPGAPRTLTISVLVRAWRDPVALFPPPTEETALSLSVQRPF